MQHHLRFIGSLLLGVALMLGVTGCQNTIKVSDRNLTQLQYSQLVKLLEENDKGQTVLVDVRNKADFDDGHIPGAINIRLPDIVAGDKRLAKAQQIIVYSSGWTDPLSRAAGKKLLALGYEGVHDFRGGVEAWQTEGRMLAVTRDEQSPQTNEASMP